MFRLIFALGITYFVIDPYLYFFSILIFLGLPISFYLIRKYLSPLAAGLALPVLWTFWDYLEAQYTLLPMTLVMLGSPLAISSFLGLARFGGIIGLTLFAALINLFLTFLIISRKNKRLVKILIILTVLILVSAWQISDFLLKQNKNFYLSRENTLNVVLFSADKVKYDFDGSLSELPLSKKTDLLVIPENLYKSNLENFGAVINFYQEAAKNLGVDLVGIALRENNGKVHKSAILFSRTGEILDIYDKNYLTITSEDWPFENWRPFYFNSYFKKLPSEQKKVAIFDRRYQHESGEPSLIKGKNFSFASPICLEVHYPFYLQKLSNLGADFILHNSNNDWIKRGLSQYLKLTNNFRTIEAVWLKNPILVSGIREYAGIFYPDGTNELIYPQNGIAIKEVTVRLDKLEK